MHQGPLKSFVMIKEKKQKIIFDTTTIRHNVTQKKQNRVISILFQMDYEKENKILI